MSTESKPSIPTQSPRLVITRIFDVPRELVWKAWTEPERVKLWWSPKGFTTPVCRIDLRVGGKYHYCMLSAEGKEYWGTGTYKEIVPLERIVCTDSFSDAQGNVVAASTYGMSDDIPIEMTVIVSFEDLNGRTKMTLQHIGMPAAEMSETTNQGWNEFFDKLAALLER